jgi:hypothetical protein
MNKAFNLCIIQGLNNIKRVTVNRRPKVGRRFTSLGLASSAAPLGVSARGFCSSRSNKRNPRRARPVRGPLGDEGSENVNSIRNDALAAPTHPCGGTPTRRGRSTLEPSPF